MAPEIKLRFPGNLRVDADFGDFSIATDQRPRAGGEGSAPEPYSLFLASIAACAGYYVLAFCRQRELPVDGIAITQRHVFDDKKVLSEVLLDIAVPPEFPGKYHSALVRAAENCAVKKAIAAAPSFRIETRQRAAEPAVEQR